MASVPFMRQADLCTFQNTHSSSLDLFAHHSATLSIVLVGNQIDSGVAVRSRPTRGDGDQKLLFGVRPALTIARPLGRHSDSTRSRASHPALVARVAAGVAEELSLLPDRGSEQPQARRQDREDRQPHHVAPMTAIDGHVRCGIQLPASCLETRTTEAAPAATPRMGPVRSRISVCQIVMDSSCCVVAPTRRSRKSALSPFDRGHHERVHQGDHDPADAEQ
jgi:hypothetical protein